MDRTRLWKEKLFAASVMIASLGIVHGIATAAMGRLNPAVALLGGAFAVTAICSVAYHTLATRSVLLGIACAVGLPYALALCTYLFVSHVIGLEIELSERAFLALTLSACAAYSAFSLWLSRRQFVGLQLKDSVVSRAAEVPAALVPKMLSDLVCSQPTGITLNLIRKELCLHKPIFLVSAIFIAAWLLTLLVMLLRPAWHDHCVATLNGLTGAQAVLMVILGGCTALGDDKALGTSTWHLTLPVSARRQWFIKFGTAFGTTFALAVILPTLLAVLTLFKAKVGILAIPPGEGINVAIPFALVFVVSFWSASMMTNTVRAALTCVITLMGVFTMIALGFSLSDLLFKPFPLQLFVAKALARFPGVLDFQILLVCLIGTLAALVQSLALFRRGQTPVPLRIKYAIFLAVIVVAGAFWCADLNRSIQAYQQQVSNL